MLTTVKSQAWASSSLAYSLEIGFQIVGITQFALLTFNCGTPIENVPDWRKGTISKDDNFDEGAMGQSIKKWLRLL